MKNNRRRRGIAVVKENGKSAWDSFRYAMIFSTFFSIGLSTLIVEVFYPEGLQGFLTLLWGQVEYLNFKPDVKYLAKSVEYLEWKVAWIEAREYFLWFNYSAIGFFLLGFCLAFWILRRKGEKSTEGTSVREGERRLISPEELRKEIDQDIKNRKTNNQKTRWDIFISDSRIRVTDKNLSASFAVAGASGSGKTVIISEMIAQSQKNGERIVVVDINGEFYESMGRPGDIVLSLGDPRSEKWTFKGEDVPEQMLADGLAPVPEHGDEAIFWAEGGRDLLAGILRNCNSLEELWIVANYSFGSLRSWLSELNDIAKQRMGEAAGSKLGEGMANTATSKLKLFLRDQNHFCSLREQGSGIIEKPFSLKSWVLDPEDSRSVFIIVSQADMVKAKPLMTLWLHIIMETVLQLPVGSARRGMIYIDEISSLGRIPSLLNYLDRCRKYGWRATLGFQTSSQLSAIYGEAQSATILSGLQNRIIFRLAEPKAARLFSGMFGSREVQRSTVAYNLTDQGGATHSTETTTESIVTESQFLGLQERHAYVQLCGHNPTLLSWTYVTYKKVNEPAQDISKRGRKSWLESIELKPYRNKIDRERLPYLNEVKGACDEFLLLMHSNAALDPEMLERAYLRIKKLAGNAAGLREVIDESTYEISHKGNILTVSRDHSLVSVDIRSLVRGKISSDESLE